MYNIKVESNVIGQISENSDSIVSNLVLKDVNVKVNKTTFKISTLI
jgi:hypothetical protein